MVDLIWGAPRTDSVVVPRNRLHRRLDAGSPVTIVYGRSGSGKTTLLADWVNDQDDCTVVTWISLNTSDEADPAPAEAVLAALSAGARCARSAPEQADPSRLVIVDDAHRLPGSPVWERLVEEAGAGHFRLLVCTTPAQPADEITVLSEQMTMISEPELQFRPEEAVALAAGLGRRLTPPAADQLCRVTDGQPGRMGHILRDSSAAPGRPVPGRDRARRGRRAPIGAATTGRATRHRPIPAPRAVPSLAATTGPEAVVARFEDRLAARDWDGLMRIWSEHGRYLTTLDTDRVYGWLCQVPEDVRRNRPSVAIAQERLALVLTGRDSDEDGWQATLTVYARTSQEQVPRIATLPLSEGLYIGAGHIIGLRLGGRLTEAQRFAARLAEHVTSRLDRGEPAGDMLCWFYLQAGLLDTLSGDYQRAAASYIRGWRHGVAYFDPHMPANCAANLALVHAVLGNAVEAQRWLERHNQMALNRNYWGWGLAGVGAEVAAAALALDDLRLTDAETHLSRVAANARPVELWPFIAFYTARLALARSDATVGLADLDEAIAGHPVLLRRSGAATALLGRARVELLVASGHPVRATELLGTLSGEHLAVAHTAAASARIALLSGDPLRAESVADHFLHDQRSSSDARLELLVIAATAAHTRGDSAVCARHLHAAGALHRRNPTLRLFAGLNPALYAAIAHLPEPHLTDDERRRASAAPAPYPAALEVISLTRRQRDLLRILVTTSSREQMASQLFVSVNTVKSQLGALYRKLGVTTRADALARAARAGLLDNLTGAADPGADPPASDRRAVGAH